DSSSSARATLLGEGLPVSLVVEFDEDRRAARVRGERYRAVEGGQAVLSPWSGSCTDYRDFSGLQVPSQVEVSWDFNEGAVQLRAFPGNGTAVQHRTNPRPLTPGPWTRRATLGLRPSPIAPQIHVQARTEPEALPLADLRQPHAPLAQHTRVDAFRHQNHLGRIRIDRAHQLPHVGYVFRPGNDKLELVIVIRHQPPHDFRLNAQALVPLLPLTRGRRIGQLRADAHQVALDRREHRAGRLDRDVSPARAQTAGQYHDFARYHRLAAGHHNVAGGVSVHRRQDALQRPVVAFRMP